MVGRRFGIGAGLLAVLSLAHGATAAAPEDQLAPDLVSALVVQAIAPGPAFWKIAKGGSTVSILGLPPYTPANYSWDDRAFQRRLAGSRVLITLPPLRPEPVQIGKASARPAAKVASTSAIQAQAAPAPEAPPAPCSVVCVDSRPLPGQTPSTGAKTPVQTAQVAPLTQAINLSSEESSPQVYRLGDLPPGIRAQYVDVFTRLTHTPGGTDDVAVVDGAQRLTNLMFDLARLDEYGMQDKLSYAARQHRVPVNELVLDPQKADLEPTVYMSDPQLQTLCLQRELGVAQSAANPYRDSLSAWARGDLSGALASVGCLAVKAPVYQLEADTAVDAIEKALAAPGKSMAAVELVPLLIHGGVIEHLEADGYQVTGPDSPVQDEAQ